MKSKASIGSHPIHPMLIPFPIAFFSGTLAAHAVSLIWNLPQIAYMAYLLNIAGIIMAVAAAIPGLIDFINTVPPKSSGKKRAAKHALTNTTMLLLFTVAAFYRRNDDASQWVVLGLEVVGFGLMMFAGWMGATLVYRNQIGVDVRYGNAGKWQEEHLDANEKRVVAANVDDLKVNAMKLLHVGDKRIVLARTEDGFVAFADRCPHKGASLAGGSLMCGTVQCPWHGSQFSVRTGAVTADPSKEGIKTYPVMVENGRVMLDVEVV
jgi:nitrite reductase/ring-hydroxylating ferredoxin subunit/uncharacterized membrane protein